MSLVMDALPPPSLVRELEAQVRIMVERYHLALEQMCEAMLVDPQARGVYVERKGLEWTMRLSEDVPFGEIHERLL